MNNMNDIKAMADKIHCLTDSELNALPNLKGITIRHVLAAKGYCTYTNGETNEKIFVIRKTRTPNCLPIVEFADKDPLYNGKFYADYRLLQLRKVNNPHMFIDFANREEMDEYISTSNIATF